MKIQDFQDNVTCGGFETLIATAIDSYYNNNQIGAVEIAKIGQYAENFYFGSPSYIERNIVYLSFSDNTIAY